MVAVPLVLDSALKISVTDNSLTLSGNITNGTASHGITALGGGQLVLAGNNTFSGGFTLDSSVGVGTVVAASSTALGAGPVTLLGPPTSKNSSVGVLDLASDVSASAYNVTVTGSASGVSAANIVADKATAASAGIIHNLGTLTLQGAAGVTLNFSGGANVASGTAGLAFGATTLAGPTTFSLTNPVAGGTFLLSLGALTNGGNNITIEGNGSFAQTGAIAAGSGKLLLDPTFSGTATLSQANLYTGGTILNAGTLAINNNSALGTGRLTINGGILDNSSGATVTLGNVAQTWAADFAYTGTGGSTLNLGTGPVTLGANRTVTVNGGNLAVGGAISGNFSLTKQGLWILTLSQANLYTGGTILNAGTLAINNNSALGTGRLTINGGILDNSSGATVTLGNVAQTWAADFAYTGTGGSTLNLGTGPVTLGANRTVTVNGGNLGVGGAIGGNFSLTKQGAGTLTLGAANSLTGGINVSAGQLVIGNLSALGSGTLTLTGGTAQLQAGLTSSAGAPMILPMAKVAFAGGKLDIANNIAVLTSGTDISAAVAGKVRLGTLLSSYGHRDGGGTSGPATTVGYLTGAEYMAFNGNTLGGYAGSLAANDVVLKWTYPGDITLDGYVNANDYALLDIGYLSGFDGTSRKAQWENGDFNGDGVVNVLDFQLADASLEQEGNMALANQMIALHTQMFGAGVRLGGAGAGFPDAARSGRGGVALAAQEIGGAAAAQRGSGHTGAAANGIAAAGEPGAACRAAWRRRGASIAPGCGVAEVGSSARLIRSFTDR